MNTHRASSLKSQASGPSRSFTLAELLVVMGIMAILGVLTALSYRGIARDAKLASGKNTVAAVLDNARGLAMKHNRIVVVVFRPRLDGPHEQYVEAVIAQWTGESAIALVDFGSGPTNQVIDRFVPIPGVPVRALPKAIKIAAPRYGIDDDFKWMVVSHLPAINQNTGGGEAAGQIIGVMYAPDGTTITRNTATDSARLFVDFDDDREHEWGAMTWDWSAAQPYPGIMPTNIYAALFEQDFEDDETWVDIAPFIAVLDDEEARELKTSDWNVFNNRVNEYSAYITNNVDPIHFNRYTGVVMKK